MRLPIISCYETTHICLTMTTQKAKPANNKRLCVTNKTIAQLQACSRRKWPFGTLAQFLTHQPFAKKIVTQTDEQ